MHADASMQLGNTVGGFQRIAMRRWPDREALVGGGVRLSYRELGRQANAIARFMKALGLVRGDAIALLSGSRWEVIATTQAAQILGLRYTPLHPMGSEQDHAFVLDDAGIDVLIVDAARYGERARALAGHRALKQVLTFGASDAGVDIVAGMNVHADGPELAIEARPEDISSLNYTGGTTGRPKGVIHRHRGALNMVTQELAYWEWPGEVRFLVASPLSHAASAMLMPTLAKGGTFHFQDGFDPEAFMATIERERITATFMVPTMIYTLLDHPRFGDYDLSSLEMVIYGASPIAPVRLAQAIAAIGPVFCQLYGQSEAPQTVCYLAKADHDLGKPDRLSSCGLPVPANQVRLVGADGRDVAQGEPGEIWFRGPTIMDGYWNRPEENAQAFADGWLHTGDIARQDEEGYLYIVDRAKDMIISGGFNVFPREVEDCLSEHPAVAMAAVIGVPDEKWGETVKAYVVMRGGATVDPTELIAFVRERKGVVYAPRHIEFADALPVTPVGKLDRKALRAAAWSGSARNVG